jgi:hypothetical protein
MPDGTTAVESFLDALDHPYKEGVLRLRATLLASVPGLTEHVKWNAPSFVHDGVDRITFRLRPGDVLQLVFHRGPAVRSDVDSFAFADPTGLLAWQTPDRAVATFAGVDDVEAKLESVAALARRWVLA